MILRRHETGNAVSEAVYSDCAAYRYRLSRVWGSGPLVGFILLNPSTATEVQNDPTVERCERRARVMGYGGFAVGNIFAFRATDPRVMRGQADAVGPINDAVLRELAAGVERVICGWGTHGAYQGRGGAVEAMLRRDGRALWHLGLTQGGAPKHPLYIGYDRMPERWG